MGAQDVMPGDPGGQAPEPADATESRSAIVRSGGRLGEWEGVPSRAYRRNGGPEGEPSAVIRKLLAGGPESTSSFELRYFELAPGARTAHERHRHEHAVVVLQGRGEVLLGPEVETVGPGDLVLVAPEEAHQFRNTGTEPFGFLCVVDAVRDRPVPLEDGDLPSCDR